MAEENDDAKVSQVDSWGEFLTGGLPQVLLGPAGKAISRLVAGAVDIPAAWLQQKAQGIKDETAARSAVMELLSGKSAELGIRDERLLGRGLDSLLGKAYREQQNKESVARKVIEELEDDPPPPNSSGPSNDWLNVFEGHAEKASSEQLRETFSRVLAGEIRKPGSFSLLTLQFIAVLDQQTAEAARRRLPATLGNLGFLVGEATGQRFKDLRLLHDAGLIQSLGLPDVTTTVHFDGRGQGGVHLGTDVLGIDGEPGSSFSLQINAVSRVAVELLPVIGANVIDEELEAILATLRSVPQVRSVRHLSMRNGKPVHIKLLWTRSP